MTPEERKARKVANQQRRRDILGSEPPPLCASCGRQLTPYRYLDQQFALDRGKKWGYEGNNVFCTLRCGLAFALVCHRAGYRLKEKGKP